MSTVSKIILGGAAAWVLTSPEFVKGIPLIGIPRAAAESAFTVLYKTARGTGRAAWYSTTTLFFMVYPVLYVLSPEDAGAEPAPAAAQPAA